MMNTSKRQCATCILFALSTLLGACANTMGTREDPYVLFRELMPRSILILPPVNESNDANASYSWLTTASRPVADRGFYVFPVAVVDEFMKENGLPNPEDMHAAPLDKLGEIFGADAVMYVTLEEFGQKFELVQSVTRVVARAELMDVNSGQVIWEDRLEFAESTSDNSGGGLLAAVLTAAAAQIGGTIGDASHDASHSANYRLFTARGSGLLLGPMHPGYEAQMIAAAEREQAAQVAADAAESAPDTE